MKIIIFLLIISILSIKSSFSQNQKESNLCVGHYYSEEQAKEVIANLKAQYQTKEAWLQRADVIRQGILEGSGLVPFPEKLPLKPRYSDIRKYEGYSVQNVAIESLPGVFVTGSLYFPEKPLRI
jgi:uncharacterized protein